MLQVIDRKAVYVVDFDTMPELPITGRTESEERERALLTAMMGFEPALTFLSRRMTYAQALTAAIETGIITEPGEYGIHLIHETSRYEIYKIIES